MPHCVVPPLAMQIFFSVCVVYYAILVNTYVSSLPVNANVVVVM